MRDLTKADGDFKPFFEAGASTQFLDIADGWIYLHTRKTAKRGHVLAVKLNDPSHTRTVVAEGANPLTGATMEGGILLLSYREDARAVARAVRLDGKPAFEVELPKITAFSFSTGDPTDGKVFMNVSDLADPGTLYSLSLKDGAVDLVLRAPTVYNPDAFVTSQVFYQSGDGTRVPMFLVHRAGLSLDEPHPVLLRLVWRGGHYQYGIGAEDTLDTFADLLAFLTQTLGVDAPPAAGKSAP